MKRCWGKIKIWYVIPVILLIPCVLQLQYFPFGKEHICEHRWRGNPAYKFYFCHRLGIVALHVGILTTQCLAAVICLHHCQISSSLEKFIIIWLSFILSSILGAWIKVFWFHPHYRGVESPKRTLALTLLNYVEIVLIFAVFSFITKNSFDPQIDKVMYSLRYSIGIMTTMGSDFEAVKLQGYVLFYTEIAFGLLFLAIVIQRVMVFFNLPPSRKEYRHVE